MRELMERRLARLEATRAGCDGVRVFRVPRELEGEALVRWKAEVIIGIPEAGTVVWVELREAELTQ